MKIAVDIHGVINSKPKFFKEFIDLFVDNGHEVHILTGRLLNERLDEKLNDFGINYTHIFSMAQYLIESDENVHWEDDDNPWFDDKVWNEVKGEYCRKHNVDLCIDDTEAYMQHFSTPFLLYRDENFNKHNKKENPKR
ncbi:hypothetical protein KAR91_00500 [Candidatus Pacearchaeota archaeon]|nr:hypothetical protein [Candidatus Pacearchaeota archaeon]